MKVPLRSRIRKRFFILEEGAFLREGNYSFAINSFEKALKVDGEHTDALYYTGLAWEKQEEFLMAQQFL